MMNIAVRNAAQAVDTVLSYMKKRDVQNAPPVDANWQEKTLYSEEPQDLAVTAKLFTSNDWMIEVRQNVAPLSRTVYQLTVFNAGLRSYWKGNVKADTGLVEVSAFGSLSEDENRQAAEEFSKKSKVPPPKPGGYGH